MAEPTLYPKIVKEHAKQPQLSGQLEAPTHEQRVDNPLCGDRVTLQLQVEDGTVVAVRHRTRGCALCVASASLLAGSVQGQEVASAVARADRVQAAVRALAAGAPAPTHDEIAQAFAGVVSAPARLRCVLLPWDAICELLAPDGD